MSVAVVVLAAAAVPGLAWADGDPASDVLASQLAFVPWDVSLTPARTAQLDSLLRAAARAGFPIRVALIRSPTDLGSVTALWDRPAAYAHFLSEELSLLYRGRVLVVMPDGNGLALDGQAVSLPSGLAVPRTRAGLAPRAAAAVLALARADGRRLSPAAVTATPPPATTAQTPIGAVVFVVGVVLIVLAWAVSFRARPPAGRARRLFMS